MAAQKAVSTRDMNGLKIIRLGKPDAPGDAANKEYVDSIAVSGGSGIPPGVIWEDAGTTAPVGWLMCDGSVVNRTDYPALFARIGTNYNIGGEAATQFRLPNRKGRAGVGRDTTQPEFNTLGQVGGVKAHILTAAELPSHNHTFQGGSHTFTWGARGLAAPVHAQNAIAAGGDPPSNNLVTSQGYWSQTNYSGGGAAHNNLQPYITLNYIIKT
jgi:microcystin-dependent protein